MSELLPNAYLNGQWVALTEARVSPLDRGFLFGDGVYEVLAVFGGQPLKLASHLARLAQSLSITGIDNPLAGTAGPKLIEELIARNGGGNLGVYIQITRGTDPAGRNHAYPSGIAPTVFAMCQTIDPRAPDIEASGVAAVTRPDSRWQRCDIKATSLLANVMLRQSAEDAGAAESILIRDGVVTEGAASSVVVVSDGRVRTPRRDQRILPGTTLMLIEALLGAADIVIEEADIRAEELHDADEIWLVSTMRELLPVCRLDGRAVGNGRPGPLWREADRRYQERKGQLAAAAERTTLLAFPCDFPIKIMGEHSDALRPAIDAVVADQAVTTVSVSERPSRGGKYLAVTLTVNAQSQAQLDRLYAGITAIDAVKVVL